MGSPKFYVFDGLDGAGKSTQMDAFEAWLRELGHPVLRCRDPGSSPLGERIRDLLLDPSARAAIGMRAEMLLYMAARAQLVDEVIRPALARGESVISDRFLLANVVYQGHAGGIDVEAVWDIGRLATDGLVPDLTFVLDVDPVTAAARRTGTPDRIEQRGREFFTQVRAGYLAEVARDPAHYVLIDARESIELVREAIRSAAAKILD